MRATEVVRVSVNEAETTNQQIAGLAAAAQKIGDVVKLISDIAGADQPAGAQRHHRGGARRRSRPRLCRGRLRGEVARGADRQGDRGDRLANSRRAGLDQRRGRCDPRHRRPHEGNLELHLGGRGRGRAAERRDRRNLRERRRRRPRHRAWWSSVLGDVAGAATATRSSAETVLAASRSVESAVGKLRGEVESFLAKVARPNPQGCA